MLGTAVEAAAGRQVDGSQQLVWIYLVTLTAIQSTSFFFLPVPYQQSGLTLVQRLSILCFSREYLCSGLLVWEWLPSSVNWGRGYGGGFHPGILPFIFIPEHQARPVLKLAKIWISFEPCFLSWLAVSITTWSSASQSLKTLLLAPTLSFFPYLGEFVLETNKIYFFSCGFSGV